MSDPRAPRSLSPTRRGSYSGDHSRIGSFGDVPIVQTVSDTRDSYTLLSRSRLPDGDLSYLAPRTNLDHTVETTGSHRRSHSHQGVPLVLVTNHDPNSYRTRYQEPAQRERAESTGGQKNRIRPRPLSTARAYSHGRLSVSSMREDRSDLLSNHTRQARSGAEAASTHLLSPVDPGSMARRSPRRVRSLSVGEHPGSYNSKLTAAREDVPEAAIEATYPRVEADWKKLIDQQIQSRKERDSEDLRSPAQLPYPMDPWETLASAPPRSQPSFGSRAGIPSMPVTAPYGNAHARSSSGSETQSWNQTSSLGGPSKAGAISSDSPAPPPYYRSDDPVLIFTTNAIEAQFDGNPTVALVERAEKAMGRCYEMVVTLEKHTQWNYVRGRIRVPKRVFTDEVSPESCQAVIDHFAHGEGGVPGPSRVYTFLELVPMLAIRLTTIHKHEEPVKAMLQMMKGLGNDTEEAAGLVQKTLEPYVRQTLEHLTILRLQKYHLDPEGK